MTREDFYYLFVNANCLAEVALRQSLLEFEQSLSEQPQVSVPDQVVSSQSMAELQARLERGECDSALAGLDYDFFSMPNPNASTVPLDTSDAEAEPLNEPSMLSSNAAFDATSNHLDIDRYLHNAYQQTETIQERVDRLYLKANRDELQKLLDQLPASSPSLTTPLTGDEMNRWLALYQADVEPLPQIVAALRRLELSVS